MVVVSTELIHVKCLEQHLGHSKHSTDSWFVKIFNMAIKKNGNLSICLSTMYPSTSTDISNWKWPSLYPPLWTSCTCEIGTVTQSAELVPHLNNRNINLDFEVSREQLCALLHINLCCFVFFFLSVLNSTTSRKPGYRTGRVCLYIHL